MKPLAAIPGILFLSLALVGCAAHKGDTHVSAKTLRDSFVPVANTPPEGVLTPIAQGSRAATGKPSSIVATPNPAVAPPPAAPRKHAAVTTRAAKPAKAGAKTRAPAVEGLPVRHGKQPTAVPDAVPSPGNEGISVEDPALPITKVPPIHSQQARDARIEGTVWVRALVDTAGDVKDVRILSSIPMLDDAATAAVWLWKFKPAIAYDAKGMRVAAWVRVPVRFTLH